MAIVLFTDFGGADLYVGQVKAVLLEHAPQIPVIDLLHEAPAFNPRAGAHLLAALARQFPAGSVFLAVVDPGVGTDRDPVAVAADGRWFVGPDNGLLSVAAARSSASCPWRIHWHPAGLSRSFHGRDLFAPVAAWIARGPFPRDKLSALERLQVEFGSEDLPEIIYIDHYGNCMTGLRAALLPTGSRLKVRGLRLERAGVFSQVPWGEPFWYENSLGLAEIAVNLGSAAEKLGLAIGQPVGIEP